MDNKQIYKATLGFSLRRALWDIVSFLLLGAFSVIGLMIGDTINGVAGPAIGGVIGFIIGIVVLVVILRYVSYTFKAGQIAMMTKGITEGQLPEDVIGEGKKIVKQRFATVAGYFVGTKLIKGIFNQIGRGITALGRAVGGDAGESVGSALNSAIQTVVAYLCDCCLGWVFYRSEVSAPKATLEGATIFFKHGKTLAKNLGRVFGIGIGSFAVIGGVFGGIFYAIIEAVNSPVIGKIATFFDNSAKESAAKGESASWLVNLLASPATLPIVIAVVGGFIMWAILHSVFIRPYVLVGVLRNFMESGKNDIPTEADMAMLDSKSDKFKKLRAETV